MSSLGRYAPHEEKVKNRHMSLINHVAATPAARTLFENSSKDKLMQEPIKPCTLMSPLAVSQT